MGNYEIGADLTKGSVDDCKVHLLSYLQTTAELVNESSLQQLTDLLSRLVCLCNFGISKHHRRYL